MGSAKFELYTVLGVPQDSTTGVITRAYRRLALLYHPDRNPDGVETFKSVSDAYIILSDPERRAIYDLTGFVSSSSGGGAETPDAVSQQQRSAELADQVHNFFAAYAGSAEEMADVKKGFAQCNGNFSKMVREYLLFDNGMEAEVQRLHRLVARLIAEGELQETDRWHQTSTVKSLLKLEKVMRREREEAEEALKELAGESGSTGEDGELGALQLAIRQRQQSSYASMLDNLEAKYVSKPKKTKGEQERRDGDADVSAKRRREEADSRNPPTRKPSKRHRR